MPSIKEILEESSQRLTEVAESPYKEASVLLANSLQKDTLWLMSHDESIIDLPRDYLENMQKRENYCPLEYLLNSASFYSRDFYVDDRVLIPRPETEILVDLIISFSKELNQPTIVEVGTGSGIISILLALHVDNAKIIAADISDDALEVAKINAKKHGVFDKIEFRNSNILDNINEDIDMLVSNPPYIKKNEILEKNLSYEPDIALFGGDIGDEILKHLIDETLYRDINILACEMGFDQKEKVEKYLKKYNRKAKFYKDLAGLDRGFVVKNKNAK